MPDFEDRPQNTDVLSMEHLRAFIAVIELKSQVNAAKRLGIGQGTVSRHIKRVQDHFGGELFESGGNGALSGRGRIVEEAARAALAALERARERVATERPVLRIGFVRLARPLIERALREQRRERSAPPFEARLFEMASEAQARALARGELDVAIGFTIAELASRPDVDASIVAELPYALVLPEHAWVNGRPSARVLRTLSYVHPPTRSAGVAEAAERWLATHRITPARALEHGSATELMAYAAAGHGFGFLPALWEAMTTGGVVFAPLPDFAATAKIAVCSLRHVTPRVSALRDRIEACASSGVITSGRRAAPVGRG